MVTHARTSFDYFLGNYYRKKTLGKWLLCHFCILSFVLRLSLYLIAHLPCISALRWKSFKQLNLPNIWEPLLCHDSWAIFFNNVLFKIFNKQQRL